MEIQIAPSTYYAAIKRPPSARALSDERLVPLVRQVHAANYSCYGVRKMWHALNRLQHALGRDQVARLMKMAGVRGRSRLRRVITTKRAAGRERYPDLVRREWDNGAPDIVWVADFTHVRTSEGTVYVSFLQDAGSRRILGFTIASSQSEDLVLKAVDQAVTARRRFDSQFTGEGVIHHSDAGSQFTANAFTSALQAAGVQISMDGRGAWRDNVFIERFWWTLKHEEVYLRAYDSVWEARQCISNYLDYYNADRFHSSLEDQTPVEAYTRSLPAAKATLLLPGPSQPQAQVMSLC